MAFCLGFFRKSSCFFLMVLMALVLNSCSKQVKTETAGNTTDKEVFEEEDTLEIQTIKGDHFIAIAVPLTGPYRDLGNSIVEGATIAVEEFNKSSREKIGTMIIDDGGLASEGLARADIIIAQKALGVIGHLNSEISIEAAKKYAKANIAAISPASTHPKLTQIKDLQGYVYRTIGTDKQLGKVSADFVIKDPSIKKVAVLYNDRPYGVSVASEFVNKLSQDATKELVLYQTIPVRTSQHMETARKVVNAGADLVFFIGEYNDAGFLLKSLKQLNPAIKFLGSEGIYHERFIAIAGNDAEGALIVGSGAISSEVENKYRERFGKPSSGYVGTSYKATSLLLDAIQKNNFKNSGNVAKSLAGNQIFNANGDLVAPEFVIYKVERGQFKTASQS